MSTSFAWRCGVCDAPAEDYVIVINPYGRPLFGQTEWHTHPVCATAWLKRDQDTIQTRRRRACEAGHHRFPGRWQRDPADPYGDAVFWDCAKGCGHRQRHPGYGHGRAVHELRHRQHADSATQLPPSEH